MLTIEGQRRMAAEKIADDLFQNHFGDKAIRLVMETASGIDCGGWSKQAVIVRIEKILTELDM